ncbi:MAG: hypothetical protein V4671_27455 [Armatimonadota bacterium]
MGDLVRMLRQVASGEDQSRELVLKMDTLLSEKFPSGEGFPDADAFEELEVAVACYRPGGGQFMYDEAQMASVCASVLARLNSPF